MKTFITLALLTGTAAAESHKLVEDAALGTTLAADKRMLIDTKASSLRFAKCAETPATGSAVFSVEVSTKRAVTTARVHGSGKPALDACLAGALKQMVVNEPLTAPIGIVGRIDLAQADGTFFESPRVSSAAVLVNAHTATWQLTVNRIGYTSNRAQDIAAALDGASAAIAACSAKRGAKAEPAEALAWVAGKGAAFRSGNKAYDACVGKTLGKVKLPAADSAMWMHVAIMKPAEPLAPRTTKAGLSKADALRDALTTAVRSRKLDLLACTDGKPKAKLTKVGVALKGGKASIVKVSTGNTDADACVRNKLSGVAIPNAAADDKLELEITLEAAAE
ncbi:MAG: hypothetical protein M4D80_34710 [Myxococcota bacterium]|nr:hypothetical protein [Deltaproteobacteria bacterium]MDQ3340340.1 hypothetical protein [Myxococcota bacterium]